MADTVARGLPLLNLKPKPNPKQKQQQKPTVVTVDMVDMAVDTVDMVDTVVDMADTVARGPPMLKPKLDTRQDRGVSQIDRNLQRHRYFNCWVIFNETK